MGYLNPKYSVIIVTIMIGTRDLFLFLASVVFLLVAIASSIEIGAKNDSWSKMTFNDENVEYTAVIPETENDNRSENLKMMKDKVASAGVNKNFATVIASEEVIEPNNNTEEITIIDDVVGSIDNCPTQTSTNVLWSPQNLKFEVVEGARIIYRELEKSPVAVNSTSSTDLSSNTVNREVVLQLPLRSVPYGKTTCIDSDVIGVAVGGSLMRNNEHTAYRIFGSETLIGYALDGFPIYGLNDNLKTDKCGGEVDDGQYRYYLSSEREGLIGCYAGVPVNL